MVECSFEGLYDENAVFYSVHVSAPFGMGVISGLLWACMIYTLLKSRSWTGGDGDAVVL